MNYEDDELLEERSFRMDEDEGEEMMNPLGEEEDGGMKESGEGEELGEESY